MMCKNVTKWCRFQWPYAPASFAFLSTAAKCSDKYDTSAPLTFADYQRARDTLAGIVRDEFDFETVWP